ncbi:MAG: methyltransferase domain-containing protein [Alphaproteobacteria bacterium]|jgi:SAM-dependent methyltransferase|nr:class I SAM-dependent methyltransferase [Alphaproteobacteria bacterium]
MASKPAGAPLFDEARLRRHRALSSSIKNPTGLILQRYIEEDLAIKVKNLRLCPDLCRLLIWGSRLDQLPQTLGMLFPKATIVLGDVAPSLLENRSFEGYPFPHEKEISFEENSLDLALSCLSLQTLNDPLSVLENYYRLLSPGGVFIASFLGGQTLQHLHQGLLSLELSLDTGAHQRVIPMIDLSTALSLLQQAGFTGCIADRDALSFSFKSLDDFRHFLKTLGLQAPLQEMPPTSKRLYRHLKALTDLTTHVIFDVISVIGWKKNARYPALDVSPLS